MRVSQKLDYACRALIHLASEQAGDAVARADDIAAAQDIPPSFLAQILHELKRGGLVTSRRGKTGGWRLAHPPGQINLAQVVGLLEPDLLTNPGQPGSGAARQLHGTWAEARAALRSILEEATLEKIASSGDGAPMYFI